MKQKLNLNGEFVILSMIDKQQRGSFNYSFMPKSNQDRAFSILEMKDNQIEQSFNHAIILASLIS
ncbi:MAG: hypothetical protein MUC97_02525 [Bernardetiaceae bacterium]|jgi:hypothetical protein|nr:hypothetical protein [Bernardetiaceae bacterium]